MRVYPDNMVGRVYSRRWLDVLFTIWMEDSTAEFTIWMEDSTAEFAIWMEDSTAEDASLP